MSSEVGSGHISIFPVMTGFKGMVTRGARDAGAAGAKSFGTGFKGAGSAAGRSIGSGMKSALTSSAGDMGAAALRKLNADVAKASAALSRARLKQQDEAGKVRVAEAKLREAIEKSGEGSARAVAAEERLATARRREQAATDAVTAATTRLRAAQDRVSALNRELAKSTAAGSRGLRTMAKDFRAGFTSSKAATSAFTGVAGSLGGIARAASNMTGLTAVGRLANLGAQQASRAFTSLATMVSGRMAAVGGSVSQAFTSLGGAAASAGRTLASPFMQLGSRVASYLSPVTTQVSGLFAKIAPESAKSASGMVAAFGRGAGQLAGAVGRAVGPLASRLARAGADAGRALGNGIKNAATGVVGAAAAGIGAALTGGFGRLTAIDQARAKLTGLGHDGDAVAGIMKNANAAVKGTAFGLDEAATTAAGAVAAGIKPGKSLEGVLEGVANVAAATNRTMADTGNIFNTVAANGKASTNEIKQLSDSGLPIWQELGKVMGKTQDEVRAMASSGEIDFETFSKAAANAAGTVADEMGKTVPGAFKNLRASVNRIGANIFGGINEETGEMYGLYSKIGPLLQSVTAALGPVESIASKLGKALEDKLGPGLERATEFFNRLGDGTGTVGDRLKQLAPALAPLAAGFAALGAGGLAGLIARIPILGGLLGGLAGPLQLLGGPLGIAAAMLAAFFASGADAEGLASAITGVVDQVVSALPAMIDSVVSLIPVIVEGILSALPQLIGAAVQIVTALVEGIVTAVPLLVEGALTLISGLTAAIIENLPAIIEAAIQLVTALVEGIVTAVPVLVEGAIQIVTSLLTAIVDMLPTIIEGGVDLLMALIDGIIKALPTLVDAALTLVSTLLDAIVNNLPAIIDAGITLLLSLVDGILNSLPTLITAAITLVVKLVAGLLENLPKLIAAGIQLVVALVSGLIQAIPDILATLPQIISAIWNGLAGVDWVGLGRDLINGLINGLKSMAGSLLNAVRDMASNAWNSFTSFFGIHSPSRLMYGGGVNVVQGAVNGIDDQGDSFGDSLVSMAKDASGRAQRAMRDVSMTVTQGVVASRTAGARGTAEASGALGGAGESGVSYTFNATTHDPRLAAREAFELFRGRRGR